MTDSSPLGSGHAVHASLADLAGLAAFDAVRPEVAEREVLDYCASRVFARTIVAGRPYRDPAALDAAVDAAFAALSWDDIVEGMSAHPRIGERGDAQSASQSAREQSGAATASEAVRQQLADGNLAYEERFGHVFLICATGLSGPQLLAQLRARLDHDDTTERAVVRQELLKITRLRMGLSR
jgi:2-oxo-4-hydroxy-4-carboxy-5-ureidoimidazoline decarboxylase